MSKNVKPWQDKNITGYLCIGVKYTWFTYWWWRSSCFKNFIWKLVTVTFTLIFMFKIRFVIPHSERLKNTWHPHTCYLSYAFLSALLVEYTWFLKQMSMETQSIICYLIQVWIYYDWRLKNIQEIKRNTYIHTHIYKNMSSYTCIIYAFKKIIPNVQGPPHTLNT